MVIVTVGLPGEQGSRLYDVQMGVIHKLLLWLSDKDTRRDARGRMGDEYDR